MTLSTTTNRASYSGDGSTIAFAAPFLFLANSHIEAVLRDAAGVETTWVENTQYTLTGAGNPAGGTLTVEISPTDYTPATGETFVIRRVVPETQETDYPEGGAFPASAHEDALDKLTMLLQQHSEELTRTLASPVSDSTFGEMPLKSDLANNVLAFNANGDPIPGQMVAGTASVSSFITTLLDDVNAATARATLGAVIGTDVLAPDGVGSSLTGLFGSTDDGSNLSGIHIQGKQTIWIPAAAILSRTTSGAEAGSAETSTNKVMLKTLDFDSAADEYAQVAVKMPKGWDASTLTAQFVWSHAAASSYGVRFFIQAVSLADGDAADTAFGTAVGHTADTGGTTNDIYITPETGAITIGNTPAKSEWVVFQIYRDVSDAGDTLNVDARLLGIHIHYTTNAGDDT